MLDRDPRRLAAWAAAALVLVLLAAWYLARSRPDRGRRAAARRDDRGPHAGERRRRPRDRRRRGRGQAARASTG